jgi:hypothetical protein
MKVSQTTFDPESDPEVKRFMEALISRGFELYQTMFSPQSFGDFLVDLCSRTICCRLVRDRSQWSIEIRVRTSGEWFDLMAVRVVIVGSPGALDWPIREQIEFLIEHFDPIESIFDPVRFSSSEAELRAAQNSLCPLM